MNNQPGAKQQQQSQQQQSQLREWFGTHWTVVVSVAIILLGGYDIVSSRDGDSANAMTATEQPQAANPPATQTPRN